MGSSPTPYTEHLTPVSRAVIPCGGKGTRMRALTGGSPKEMLPVAGLPLVERAARECDASGLGDVLVVLAPGKEAVERHLRPLAGARGMPTRVEFVVQHAPRGLADAIRLGYDFADGGPLAVVLPDNLFLGDVPALAQVAAAFARTRTSVVAVVEVLASQAGALGATAVVAGTLDGDDFRIERIPGKGESSATFDIGRARSAFTHVGRYVFTRELWPAIDDVERELGRGAELDDVPVMQRLLARGRLAGCRLRGRFIDAGVPSGYAEANALVANWEGARGRG